MLILQWGYVAAMLVAVAVLLRRRVHVPIFFLYTYAGIAFMLTQPNIQRWHIAPWLDWQRVLMVLRFACCAEILAQQTAGLKRRERAVYLLIETLIPAGIVYAAWRTDAPLAVFRHAEAGIAVAILLAMLIRWDLSNSLQLVPIRSNLFHAALFVLLMCNRVAGLMLWYPGMPAADWQPLMALSYSVGITLFCAWALFVRSGEVAMEESPCLLDS